MYTTYNPFSGEILGVAAQPQPNLPTVGGAPADIVEYYVNQSTAFAVRTDLSIVQEIAAEPGAVPLGELPSCHYKINGAYGSHGGGALSVTLASAGSYVFEFVGQYKGQCTITVLDLLGWKQERIKLLKTARDARMNGTVVTTYGEAQCDESSRVNLTGLVVAAQLALAQGQTDWTGQWKMLDNSFITLTAAEMIDLGNQVGGFVQRTFAYAETLIAQVNAAADKAALDAIDIDTGWPD